MHTNHKVCNIKNCGGRGTGEEETPANFMNGISLTPTTEHYNAAIWVHSYSCANINGKIDN